MPCESEAFSSLRGKTLPLKITDIGITLLKYVLIPNVSLKIKSKKEYLREWCLLVFEIHIYLKYIYI